jgi:hypothetical protein
MPFKRGWTAERHRDVGARLKLMRRELLDVLSLLCNYRVNGAENSAGNQALRRLDALRCKLDDAFAREHPAEFDPHAYYGSNEARLVSHDRR